MPLPLSTALFLGAIGLARLPSSALHVAALIMICIGVLNETIRAFIATRALNSSREYTIPAVGDPVLRERTPIIYQSDDS